MAPTQEELFILWGRFQGGDSVAFGQLCQQHYGLLFNYGTKFSKDPEFIKDCLQELFLDLWHKRSQLSHTPFVKAYLLTALRNRVLKELRRTNPFLPLEELGFEASSVELSRESILIEDEHLLEQVRQLQQGIQQLSKRQREIIYLRFYQQLNHAEIGQLMNLSQASVSNLLCRSLKELKNKLSIRSSLLITLLLVHMTF